MTSPTSVGSVSVEVLGDTKELLKDLREGFEKGLKGLDKAVQDAVGTKPIKVPVQADTAPLEEKVKGTKVPPVKVPMDPETEDIPEKTRKTKVPKIPVPLDPLAEAFQQEVRRLSAQLAKQAIKIPLEGDGAGLRTELGQELARIQAESRIQVPTEPGDRAAYESKLRADVESVAARVKAAVPVVPDTRALAAKMKAEAAAAAKAAKATINVDVDRRGSGGIGGLSRSALSGIADGLANIGQTATQATGAVLGLGGGIAGAANTASGPVGVVATALAGLAVAIGGVAAAAVFAVPAISTLAGAIAALPGLLAGAGAGFGTLALGFRGISDAFKKKPGGGGGGGGGGGEDPASRARRIAGAERGVEAARRGIAAATRGLQAAERAYDDAVRRVAEAQRRAAQAQEAVNRARREAKEDLEDLNRSLAGAKLSEEDAALRVTEALRELNQARESGVLPDIQRADLEYRQAQQALDEAKDSTEDLSEATAEANAKGVEGSDQVQGALEDQRDAIQAVKDAQEGVVDAQNAIASANDSLAASYDGLASAQDALAEAQKKTAAGGGGGGGALADVVKLAPEAEKFVAAVKALKPAFEDLRLDVQNRLFKDLDETVTHVADAWLPALRTTLGGWADTFNGFFKNLGKNVSKPQFIEDLQTGAEGARKGFEEIGKAISGPLVEAFGTLSAASAPFLEALGEEIADVVTEFSEWVQAGKESGALQDFFDSATQAMRDIFTTGKTVASIIGSLISIIAGRELKGKSGKTPLQQFNEALQDVADWLDDPAHQEGIRQFFESIINGIEDAAKVVRKIDGWIEKIKTLLDLLGGDDSTQQEKEQTRSKGLGIGDTIARAVKDAGLDKTAATAGSDVGKATGDGFFAGIKDTFKKFSIAGLLWEGPNSLIGKIKSGLGISSPSKVMSEIGEDLVAGLIKGIGDKFGELGRKAGELRDRVRDAFSNATGFLVQKGRDLAAGLRDGMQSAKESLGTKAGELKKKVSDAFSNASTLLYKAGQAITGSLQSGMRSAAAGLGGYLNSLATYIKANKGPIEKDRKLLIPEGQAIMQGLIGGIASKRDALGAQLADLTGMVGATSFPDLGADADAAISRSLKVAGANSLQASWAPGMTGDKLLDALRGQIQFSFNGQVDAALGSAG